MSSRAEKDLARVLRYCARWQVPVKFYDYGSRPCSSAWHPGSRWGGIAWEKREIGWPRHCVEDNTMALALLHELSHVVVEIDPEEVDEVHSAMLAFEALSARRLRLGGWTKWMRDYTVSGVDWPRLSPRRRHDAVYDSLLVAVETGLLDREGRPTYRRIARG